MNEKYEAVRSLEQQESGEMVRLRCVECARPFSSVEQFARHRSFCALPRGETSAAIE